MYLCQWPFNIIALIKRIVVQPVLAVFCPLSYIMRIVHCFVVSLALCCWNFLLPRVLFFRPMIKIHQI